MKGGQRMKYLCTAFLGEKEAIVTTNDAAEFDRLLQAGGTIVCHPDLFNRPDAGNDRFELAAVPYSVQIPLDKLAQFRSVPRYKFESYETRVY